MVSPRLLERLRSALRRDPTDGDVSFLLSLAVREPFVVYATERERLRRLSEVPFRRTARAEIVAEAAEELLRTVLKRRPDSGTMEVVRPQGTAMWRSAVASAFARLPRRARARRVLNRR